MDSRDLQQSSVTSPEQSVNLLSLPPELRHVVYLHLIGGPDKPTTLINVERLQSAPRASFCSLLYVCRTIYNEFLPVMLTNRPPHIFLDRSQVSKQLPLHPNHGVKSVKVYSPIYGRYLAPGKIDEYRAATAQILSSFPSLRTMSLHTQYEKPQCQLKLGVRLATVVILEKVDDASICTKPNIHTLRGFRIDRLSSEIDEDRLESGFYNMGVLDLLGDFQDLFSPKIKGNWGLKSFTVKWGAQQTPEPEMRTVRTWRGVTPELIAG